MSRPQTVNAVFSVAALLLTIAAVAAVASLATGNDGDVLSTPVDTAPEATDEVAPDVERSTSTGSPQPPRRVSPPATSAAPASTTAPTVPVKPSAHLDDAAGDSARADIVSVSIIDDGESVVFEVRTVPSDDVVIAAIAIDRDQDPSTGSPGIDSECQDDADSFGADLIVYLGWATQPQVLSATGGCNQFGPWKPAGTARRTEGLLRATVPRSELSMLSDSWSLKVTTAIEIRTGATTGVQDVAPDVSTPPLAVVSG